jgi:hypothetical protein
MANVSAAVAEWKKRGDVSSENRLIFFFCGHGIAQGSDTSLLLADYGANVNDALTGAIDFRSFHLGMNTCAAQQQCYFIDACRASSDTLIESYGKAGLPIIRPNTRYRRPDGPREAPIYYSTIAGEDAYARPGEVSPFTDALIRGLRGAGGDDSEGDWRVSTTRLKEAIDYFLKRAAVGGQGRVQVPATSELTTFYLHHLADLPEVPVTICCQPSDAHAAAELSYRAGAQPPTKRAPADCEWEVPLQAGTYHFAAEFQAGPYINATAEAHVRPVYRKVPLKVLQ